MSSSPAPHPLLGPETGGDALPQWVAPRWTEVVVDGVCYARGVVATPWLRPEDDLGVMVKSAVADFVEQGDTVAVSEKVCILLGGHAVPVASVPPGRLARLLAGRVQHRGGSLGLARAPKMQYVLDTVGPVRVLAAALAGALTRPFGLRGVFYLVAGPLARDVDGLAPPYDDLVMPPLPPLEAAALAQQLENVVGVGVGITDINDRGGRVRAVSARSLPADTLYAALRDNPAGQLGRSTPFVIVRRI